MRTDVDRLQLPTGTVTFMFTDIERSTEILNDVGDERFRRMVEDHHELIAQIVASFDGTVVATEGDSVFGVFPDAVSGVNAGLQIQGDMAGAVPDIKVRIGLHTGTGVRGGDNYIGVDVHRASRISDSAHGGQVVISDVTAKLVESELSDRVGIRSLGRYQLSGFPEPTTLHQVAGPGMRQEFPTLRASQAESQLPVPLTGFVGREFEIDEGLRTLKGHRLLTLTGPGGTGKTRLATEIARRAEHRFGDGAYFVSLASLVDSDLIPMTILETMRVKTVGGTDPLEHLTRYLATRSVLLVLDNFEQLLEGAGVVSNLLSAAPDLEVIVTSRSPLRLRAERELPVPPLEVPTTYDDVSEVGAADGVKLFVSHAKAVRPDFELDASNVGAVSEIARALDGLPLAIELAASRMRSLTPDLVLERLNNHLLASKSSDFPARQQTIVNTIGWSYDLLDDASRRLFEQLSVFSGSFGVDEAERVYHGDLDILDGLAELVDQSLLRPMTSSVESRFRMLTVIREFAYGALGSEGEDREVLDRHAAVYLDLAQRADVEILTSRRGYWIARLAEEHDNLRAAFDHAVNTDDGPTALRLVGSLWRFWQIRGHLLEGRRRTETALALGDKGDLVARANALMGLGGIRYWQGEWDGNVRPYEQALELFREHGDDADVAEALYNLSFPVGHTGDLDRADSLLRESLAISQRIDRTIGVGRALWGMGDMATYRDEFSESIPLIEEAIEVFNGIDAPYDLGWSRFMLAYGHANMNNAEEAKPPLMHALDAFAEVRDVSAMFLIWQLTGVVMIDNNNEEKAAYCIGAAHRIKADSGMTIADAQFNRHLADFVDNLDATKQVAYEEGYNATFDEAVEATRSALSD